MKINRLKLTNKSGNSMKQTLLAFLKASHGDTSTAPKKITLKRKTTTVIKSGAGSGRKTVNVEVRKKRTYVKRDAAPSQNVDSAATATPDAPRIDDVEQKRKLALEARREADRKEEDEPFTAGVESAAFDWMNHAQLVTWRDVEGEKGEERGIQNIKQE